MDLYPKQFVKVNSKEVSHISNRDELVRDDDDPLSIKDASSTFIGIILAILTVLLPMISVLLERPIIPKNRVTYNQMVKKDGY